MRKKITFTSQVLLCFILITTLTVDAWVSVRIPYNLCQVSFSEDIHINELDARAYTNSTRVKKLTTYDQNPQSFKITVGLYGCQPQCGWQFDLEVVRSKRTVSPVQSKAIPYTCQGTTYVWPIDLNATQSLYTGDTPNPDYPFAFTLAMDYCRNDFNIDNNTKISNPKGETRSNLDCLMLYSDQPHDPSFYFNFTNNVTSHWPFPDDHRKNPAALSIIGTLDNVFTFYKYHYQGIIFVLQDIAQSLTNYLTDLGPYYKRDSPNLAIPYDFNSITKGLSDMLSGDLIQVGSLFVVSDKDDSLPLIDRNFNSLQRSVYTNEFYVRATFVADYPIKSVSDFGHYQENINEYAQAILDGMGNVLERDDLTAFSLSVHWLSQPFYEPKALPEEFSILNIMDHTTGFIHASLATGIVNNYGLTHCNSIDWRVCAQCCYALQEIVGESGTSPGSCNPAGHYDCSFLSHYNHQCTFGGYNYYNDITGFIEKMVPNLDLCAVGQNGWNVNQGDCKNADTIRCTGYPDGCNKGDCDPRTHGEYAACSC